MAKTTIIITPGDTLDIKVRGFGAIYSVFTEVNKHGDMYLELADSRNDKMLDQDHLAKES